MTDLDLKPLFGLILETDRLMLRLPDEDDLQQLANVAIAGVHAPDVMPFLVPWTDDRTAAGFADTFAQYHHGLRTAWSPEDWALELGVWVDGEIIGTQALNGQNFLRRPDRA